MSKISISAGSVVRISVEIDGLVSGLPGDVSTGLNRAAKKVRQDSIAKIVSQVNLPESFVGGKIVVGESATPAKLSVKISADKRGTNLARYAATQLTADNTWDMAKFVSVFGVSSARPPIRNANGSVYTPPFLHRKGDARRGIPPGKKANGVMVTVKKPTVLRHAFLLPTTRPGQDASKFILAQRRGAGSIRFKTLYGPSVDQMVLRIWSKDKADIADLVEQYVKDAMRL